MTPPLEKQAAAMRLRNAAYLYKRAASGPNKRSAVAAFSRQLASDRQLLGIDCPKRLPKAARPMQIQTELFDDHTRFEYVGPNRERIAC